MERGRDEPSTDADPNGQNFGHGITDDWGGQWVPLTADVSAYAGQTVLLGFRYWTDGAVVEPGFRVDEVAVGGTTYGGETDGDFTLDGFTVTTGIEESEHFNAYVVENRQYAGHDDALRSGAHNFGFPDKPDWVEHFAYEDGVLVSYWDSSRTDNDVGDHPGEGLILPVDAHPGIEYWEDGTMIRPRIQSYDSTFGRQSTTAITLHNGGVAMTIASKPADDRKWYWTGGSVPGRYHPGWSSVRVPNTGTQVAVKSLDPTGFAQIEVRAAK